MDPFPPFIVLAFKFSCVSGDEDAKTCVNQLARYPVVDRYVTVDTGLSWKLSVKAPSLPPRHANGHIVS